MRVNETAPPGRSLVVCVCQIALPCLGKPFLPAGSPCTRHCLRGKTVVGSGNLLMAYVHIGHDCVFGNNIIVSNACQFAGEVEVNDFAVIGGGSLVHQFTRVGRYVMVQGGTRFGKDIPPYVMIGREPAAFEGLNLIGLKRRGFTTAQIGEAQEVYKYLYQSGLNTTQALEAITANMERTELVGEIVDFVKSSQRGIIRG